MEGICLWQLWKGNWIFQLQKRPYRVASQKMTVWKSVFNSRICTLLNSKVNMFYPSTFGNLCALFHSKPRPAWAACIIYFKLTEYMLMECVFSPLDTFTTYFTSLHLPSWYARYVYWLIVHIFVTTYIQLALLNNKLLQCGEGRSKAIMTYFHFHLLIVYWLFKLDMLLALWRHHIWECSILTTLHRKVVK